MAAGSRDDGARDARLRQRLWGAAVLIAVLVIVLPLLLDGAGSESQFRRVERLREEPPVVIGGDGAAATGVGATADGADAPGERAAPDIRIGEDDPPDYMLDGARRAGPRAPDPGAAPTAWVVQAGSFAEEANAIAVRDRLRRAGHPSFVGAVEGAGGRAVYRVRVGPTIERDRAEGIRAAVEGLLGREAIVTGYP